MIIIIYYVTLCYGNRAISLVSMAEFLCMETSSKVSSEPLSPASLWRHKGIAMHVTHKTMHNFSKMPRLPPPALELRLQMSALKSIQPKIFNVIIGFKHGVPCLVKSGALRGYSDIHDVGTTTGKSKTELRNPLQLSEASLNCGNIFNKIAASAQIAHSKGVNWLIGWALVKS